MKRVISLLLVLVVVLGCVGLAACGGGGGGAVTTDNGGAESANGNGEGNGGDGDGNEGGEDLGDILGYGTGIDSVYYVMEITSPGVPKVTMKMWMEGNKFRYEMTMQGQTTIYLANYDTGKAYMYMPDQNMAIEMDISQTPQADYEDVQDIADYDYHVVGTDTEDGKECLVVEYSYGGATVRYWIWKEHGFPVRMETTTAEGTTVTVYKDIDFGDIDDDMFELPAGVEIVTY